VGFIARGSFSRPTMLLQPAGALERAVTQDMTIGILHDEERHRRLFEGYLRELEADAVA